MVTFDTLHSVKANVAWLVETTKAHYVAVTKPNQPTARAQLDGLDRHAVAIPHTPRSPPGETSRTRLPPARTLER